MRHASRFFCFVCTTLSAISLLQVAVTMDFHLPDRFKHRVVPSRSLPQDPTRQPERPKQRVVFAKRFDDLDPASSFERWKYRVPTRDDLARSRAMLMPPPPSVPKHVDLLRVGRGIIYRELTINSVEHPGDDNKVCYLGEKDMQKICNTVELVYEKVYRERMTVRPARSSVKTGASTAILEESACIEKRALFGRTWVDMHVRKCPQVPEFYISQGNGEGWLFVYFPIFNNYKPTREIRFEVHLGEFKELLRLRRRPGRHHNNIWTYID